MASQNFGLQVGKFVDKVKKQKIIVFKEASKELVDIMQKPTSNGGRMPVKTGFLRSSLIASTRPISGQGRPNPDKNASYNWDKSQVYGTIESIQRVNQTLHFSYGASYASEIELRYGFMRLARQKWGTIVNKVIRRVGGGRR